MGYQFEDHGLDLGLTFNQAQTMPIYAYRCTACDTRFEQLVRGGQVVICPQCSGSILERLMSLPARPAGQSRQPDFSRLGPPADGCCGGGCQSHSH